MSNNNQFFSEDHKFLIGTGVAIVVGFFTWLTIPADIKCDWNIAIGSCPLKDKNTIDISKLKPSSISYETLRGHLENLDLRAADQETNRILRRAFGAEGEALITKEDLARNPFPCLDLDNINKLWIQVGEKEKFGFTPQISIWQDIKDTHGEIYKIFADRVGWTNPSGPNKILEVNELRYSLDAKKGHLPSGYIDGLRWNYGKLFLNRLSSECALDSSV